MANNYMVANGTNCDSLYMNGELMDSVYMNGELVYTRYVPPMWRAGWEGTFTKLISGKVGENFTNADFNGNLDFNRLTRLFGSGMFGLGRLYFDDTITLARYGTEICDYAGTSGVATWVCCAYGSAAETILHISVINLRRRLDTEAYLNAEVTLTKIEQFF